jgi:hypothetical protein
MKLSKEELIEMIKQEAKALKASMLKESAVESSMDVFEVEMNSNDELGDSDKALTYKAPSKKVEKSGETPSAVKMNQKDNDQGSDEKASVAVKVDASGKKGGSNHLTGQANANFTSKNDIQGTKASGPFEDRVSKNHEVEMNTEDKVVDEKAKTYVSAGAEKGGHTHTAGQAKAEVHERMPEKDAEEPTERIAKGIEIDGSNIDLKESYSKKELKSFVLSEAKKAVDNYKKAQKRAELEKELLTLKEGLEKLGENID